MRKGITSSVFILLFTMVTGYVFAGDNSACDIYKKNKDYKGAYGLCVAYQNADEAGKIDIAANWEKRFGTGPDSPKLPGSSDFSCPCWSDFSYEQVCALGEPDGFVDLEGSMVIAGQALFPDFDNFEFTGFQANVEDYDEPAPSKCVYKLMSVFSSTPIEETTIEPLNDDELFSCLAEIEAIATSTICN